jgi:hypothetical protein
LGGSIANVGEAEPVRLRVFISYSRKAEDFAQELLAVPDLPLVVGAGGVVPQPLKYRAFLSYSHADTRWAK